jgi:hypothetical protein
MAGAYTNSFAFGGTGEAEYANYVLVSEAKIVSTAALST